MQWHTQAGNITNNLKVELDVTLPELSAANVGTWKCHVDDSIQGRYGMILGIYLLTSLGLDCRLSDHTIKAYDGRFKVSTSCMVDLGACEFKELNTGKLHPENHLQILM